MTHNRLVLSPDAMGYKDRGKMKWMGMMLSDHSEALQRQKKETLSKNITPKEKQTLEHISNQLLTSFTQKKPLSLQQDIIKGGQFLPDVTGFVVGFHVSDIFIKQRDHSIQSISIETIRHVDWINSAVWYEKYDAHAKK